MKGEWQGTGGGQGDISFIKFVQDNEERGRAKMDKMYKTLDRENSGKMQERLGSW